jgi:hypothetical protein
MTPLARVDWHGLYAGPGWRGELTQGAMNHPAKFPRGVIRRIYQEMLANDWLHCGGTVVVTQKLLDEIVSELELAGIPHL